MGGYRLDLSGSEGEPRIVLSEHGNYLMFHKWQATSWLAKWSLVPKEEFYSMDFMGITCKQNKDRGWLNIGLQILNHYDLRVITGVYSSDWLLPCGMWCCVFG